MHRVGGSTIGDGGRTSKCLSKGGDKVKGPRTKRVGKTGECDKSGVLRGAHPDGTDMNKGGDSL